MTTIDEQIEYMQSIVATSLLPTHMPKAILASLERLKKIDAVRVPEEPKCIGYWKHAEANVGIPKEDVEVLQYIDTLRDLLKRIVMEELK